MGAGVNHDDVSRLEKGQQVTHNSTQERAAKHRTLEERLLTFYGKPIDKIPRLEEREFNWGPPQGKEVW